MFFRLIIIIFFYSSSLYSLTLEKFNVDLSYPWGMTWVDSTKLLITQKKSAEIVLIDLTKNTSTIIDHQIPVAAFGQGGLLDIVYHDNNLWVSYSQDHGKSKSTTSMKSVPLL